MARKKKETETTEIMLRNPELVDKDTVAMSSRFLKQHLAITSKTRNWTLTQQALLVIALGHIKDWRVGGNNNVVVLNNRNVMKELGWNYSEENFSRAGKQLRDDFIYMAENCSIRVQDPKNSAKWDVFNIISHAGGDENITKITFNPATINNFEDLYFWASNMQQSFYTLMEPDVTSFRSPRSYLFYMDLRMQCYVNKTPVSKPATYEVNNLKAILNVSEMDYFPTRINEKGEKEICGPFNFTAFEKRVLNPVIEDINHSELMEILKNEDGKYFKKIKKNNKVVGYGFNFRVYDSDSIKKQRQLLYDEAIKEGLQPQFYPDYTQPIDLDPSWTEGWSIDEETLEKERLEKAKAEIAEKKSKLKKRNDRLAKDAKMLFTCPEATGVDVDPNKIRDISSIPFLDDEAKNKDVSK